MPGHLTGYWNDLSEPSPLSSLTWPSVTFLSSISAFSSHTLWTLRVCFIAQPCPSLCDPSDGHQATLSMGIPQARLPNSFCLSGHSGKLLISSRNHLFTKLVTASYYNCFFTLIKHSSPVIPILSPRPSELSFFTFFQSSSESCHFKNTAFFSCPLLFCSKGKTSFLKDQN